MVDCTVTPMYVGRATRMINPVITNINRHCALPLLAPPGEQEGSSNAMPLLWVFCITLPYSDDSIAGDSICNTIVTCRLSS